MGFVGKWKLEQHSDDAAFFFIADNQILVAKAKDPNNEVVEDLDLQDKVFKYKLFVNGDKIYEIDFPVEKTVSKGGNKVSEGSFNSRWPNTILILMNEVST